MLDGTPPPVAPSFAPVPNTHPAPLRAGLAARWVLPVLGLGVLAAPDASADLTLLRSGGVLGENLIYQVSGGAPFAIYALGFSVSTGPTPLSILDPLDTRSIELGLEVFQFWPIGVLNAAGAATLGFPLPADANLQGVHFHAQALSAPGAITLVDELSLRTSVPLSLAGASAFTVEDLPVSLNGHAMVTLADGSVLLLGGEASDAAGLPLGANRVLRYDPQQGAFELLAGTLAVERLAHTATLLADGTVLVVGGSAPSGQILSSAERVDPNTGTGTPVAALSEPRVAHTATLLADGRVFVAGGTRNFDFADPLAGLLDVLNSTRLFNPASNTWSNGPNLPQARIGHQATRLGDGRVLVTGGLAVTSLFGIPLPSISSDARRYNPATNSFTAAGSFNGPRAFHAQALLPDGRVLLVGGADGDILSQNFFARSDARIYDPNSNAWSNTGNASTPRAYGNLFVGQGGRVALTGGLDNVDLAGGGGTATDTIERFDVASGTWFSAGNQLLLRPLAPAVLVEGSRRVLTVGEALQAGGSPPDRSAELYVLP
jgi:N-acetylneuraminic acid mutarotase